MAFFSDEQAFAGTALTTRCYESHPVLKLGTGTLYGGAARSPKIRNADIYVVLQRGDMDGRGSDPWDKPKVTEIQYAIRDMHAPEHLTRFKKLITWVCNQLQDGKAVHVGCIGGHGRTGTVLSAIVAELLGEKNAIQYVRKHYCKKAVESHEQIEFLVKHYGVSTAKPTKTPIDPREGKQAGFVTWPKMEVEVFDPVKSKAKTTALRTTLPEGVTKSTRAFTPMTSPRSLWKAKKLSI